MASAEAEEWIPAGEGAATLGKSWSDSRGHRWLASSAGSGTVLVSDTSQPGVQHWLRGHTSTVLAMAVSRQEGMARLYTASDDFTVRIWDPQAGRAIGGALVGHEGWVTGVAQWRDFGGRPRLSSCSTDGTIRTWDPTTAKAVGEPLLAHSAQLAALASWICADTGRARLASAGDDGRIVVWDAETATPLRTLTTGSRSWYDRMFTWVDGRGRNRLAFHGEGQTKVWDPDAGEMLTDPRTGAETWARIAYVWLAADGTPRAACMVGGGRIVVGHPEDARDTPAVEHPGSVIAGWTDPDGVDCIASVQADGTVEIWNPHGTGEAARLPGGHVAALWSLAVWTGRAGTRLAASSEGGLISLWDAETGASVGTLKGHRGLVGSLTAWRGADGTNYLASIGDEGRIWLWDADRATACAPPVRTHPGWAAAVVSWSDPPGTVWLASCGTDGDICMITESGTIVRRMNAPNGWVLALAVWHSSDGPRLAAGYSDGAILIWDPRTGQTVGSPLLGHTTWVRKMHAWTGNDGVRLASGSTDGVIRVWDPDAGKLITGPVQAHVGRVGELVHVEGTGLLATSGGDDGTIRLWHPETGAPAGEPMTGHAEGIWGLAAWTTGDGRSRLASAGSDGTLRLWDPLTGQPLRAIEVGPTAMWGLSDAPTTVDTIGRQALAYAIADQLQRPVSGGTPDGGPAVVSIEGPWGCGKSTLMRMVRDRITTRPETAGRKPVRPLTVRAAGRRIRAYDRVGEAPAGWGTRTADNVVTAWFNPWTHQSGEQVWAGLAQAILETAAPVLHPTQPSREAYWFGRNLGRIDRNAIRRTLARRIVSPLLGAAAVAVVAPLALAVAELNVPLELAGYRFTPTVLALAIAVLCTVAGLLHTAYRYWWGRAADFLPSQVFHGPIAETLALDRGNGQTETVSDPLHRARAGSLYLHQHDVGTVIRDLGAAGYQLVVFVDDVDRCRADTTAEVFEAVNLFMTGVTTGPDLRARFVVGLDPVIVAAHLDRVYQGLRAPQSALHGDDPSAGWAFLRKLIQMPVVVPQLPAESIGRFVRHAIGADAPVPQRIPATSQPLVQRPATSPRPLRATGARPPAAAGAPVRSRVQTIPWRTMEQHPAIQERLIERIAAQPGRSIREAKRLINVWQLYERLVSSATPLDPAAALVRARRLVVVAEIVTRWPALQPALHRRSGERTGLQSLADQAGDDNGWRQAVAERGMDTPEQAPGVANLRDLLRRYQGSAVADLAAYLL